MPEHCDEPEPSGPVGQVGQVGQVGRVGPVGPVGPAEDGSPPTRFAPFWPFVFGAGLGLAFTIAFEMLRLAMPAGCVWEGWTYYDVPSYYADAREVFEGGNGVAYCNPYTIEAKSPVIYSNMQILAIAWMWRAGLGFRAQEILWRVAGAAAMFGLLWRVAAAFFPAGWWRRWTFLLLSLGGGATIGFAFLDALALWIRRADPERLSFLALLARSHREIEGIWGWWFLNVARNLLYSTEIFYHAMFYATMLAALSRCWKATFAIFALTWWAHPFTGLEAGTILCGWCAFEAVQAHRRGEESRPWIIRFLAFGFIQLLFLFYYGPFMTRFEEHRSVIETWRSPEARQITTAPLSHVFFSYGPLLLGLGWFWSPGGRKAIRASAEHRLLMIWAVVVFLLMHHDKLPGVRIPVQPLHFSRGYLYMVLAIWSGLLLADWAKRRPAAARRIRTAAVAVLVLLAADNLLFFGRYFAGGEAQTLGIPWVSARQRAMLERLSELPATQLVFTIEPHPARDLSYMVNTWTRHRSFRGHDTNSPYAVDRKSAYATWMKKPERWFIDTIRATAIVLDMDYAKSLKWSDEKSADAFLDGFLGPQWSRAAAPDGYILWTLKKQPVQPARRK